MSDIIQTPAFSQHSAKKLKEALSRLSLELSGENDINQISGKLQSIFREYFTNLDSVVFFPEYLKKGNVVKSKDYNDNLSAINEDITRFYSELKALARSQISSFNYAQITAQQILNKADSLASIVLDLNILNNFTRGDVIVAGDDFRNTEFIDIEAGTASPLAELTLGGGGIGLARDSSRDLINSNSIIDIFPVAPSKDGENGVNSEPTKGNIERFYEGNYYNFLGQARPEGGSFNFKYILKPKENEEREEISLSPNEDQDQEDVVDNSQRVEDGYFVDFGADETRKLQARRKMLDKDPSTFWECEYNYKAPSPLVGDIFDQIEVYDTQGEGEPEEDKAQAPEGRQVVIDLEEAEKAAQAYDFEGRDLILDLVITFPQITNVNFVAINPVLFGEEAFIAVDDISTSNDNEGQFITVDGWQRIKFPKTITPEANEFLTDTQLGVSLAPSRFAYKGQGIYPFPVRQAKRVKIRIRMDNPVGQPYERVVALLKRTIDIEGTLVTKTKKGLLA